MQPRPILWLPTYSGLRFDPISPDPSQISIIDIAHALSNQCRYAGHTKRFYSVAEHSVRLTRACSPANKPYALLHDASEAYIIDMPRPIKRLPELKSIYMELEDRAMQAILTKFGLQPELPEEVLKLDNLILLTELPNIYLFPENASPNCLDDHDIDAKFPGFEDFGWTPNHAEYAFLEMAKELNIT